MVDCYIGMGGNFTKTFLVMRQVVVSLKNNKEIKKLKTSRLYRTTPVSMLAQPPYLNAVLRFETQMPIEKLWQLLCELEKSMGKKPKPKTHPRLIDLDLLFYGSLVSKTDTLTIPHPHWHDRLFVLAPLADVTDKIPLEETVCVQELLSNFTNPHHEKIFVLKEGIKA